VELSHLVRALVAGDILTARQWVADANRAGFGWPGVPKPGNLGPGEVGSQDGKERGGQAEISPLLMNDGQGFRP